jgi:acetyl-CoA C-acetyltransferase
MGWRFVNKALKELYGTETMPETAENVAADYGISRADQDAFALAARTRPPPRRSRCVQAGDRAGIDPQKKGDPVIFAQDEHPRATTTEALAKLKGVVRADGTVTAGNASGINDGACAVLVASGEAAGSTA